MTPTPAAIDGATVLRSVDVSSVAMTGGTRHVVNGHEVEGFSWLAIAKYDTDPGYYLFYCDAEWSVVTDTYHETLESAVLQAEFEFGPLTFEEVGT